MKLTSLVATVGLCVAGEAYAGGLVLPGAGAESTARAGAGLVSADDGEALVMNPAGIAKAHDGTEITLSATIINYVMSFTRAGDYDPITDPNADADDHAYQGTKYPTIKNTAKPPLGIGSYQPVPVFAITSDLGGLVKNLKVALGLYAPNAYPFRDMTNVNGHQFVFNQNFNLPPPPTRYDIETQQAAILVPSVAAAYRVLPSLDIGARFGLAFASLKSTVALWGVPGNYSEWVKEDGQVSLSASDSMIPTYSVGANFRPTREIEVGANYTSSIDINAKGTASALNGPAVNLAGAQVVILPVDDAAARCAKGGTATALKACASLALPQNAQIGARYKFLDATGKLRGDIELDLDWENWGNNQNDYQVVIDAQVATVNNESAGIALKNSVIYHGFQDTYAARLGGSYIVPMPTADLILRGGVGYDTAAAMTGWERVDVDGAARTNVTVGVGYKMHRVQIDAGFGLILEGQRTNANQGPNGTLCNPTAASMGCSGSGTDTLQANRQGPDPTNPILDPTVQSQNPVNQGTIVSHYIEFMLGVKTWF